MGRRIPKPIETSGSYFPYVVSSSAPITFNPATAAATTAAPTTTKLPPSSTNRHPPAAAADDSTTTDPNAIIEEGSVSELRPLNTHGKKKKKSIQYIKERRALESSGEGELVSEIGGYFG